MRGHSAFGAERLGTHAIEKYKAVEQASNHSQGGRSNTIDP